MPWRLSCWYAACFPAAGWLSKEPCRYGQEASKAAKALVQLVGRVYYVQDGAVGSRGWKV